MELIFETVIRMVSVDTRLRWSVIHNGSRRREGHPDHGPSFPLRRWPGPSSGDCSPFEDVTLHSYCQRLIGGQEKEYFYIHA